MFIFAHVFAGVLLGLLFWHLTNDRRAVLVCGAGSIIPDAMDKSLAILFPSVLGSGRTVFHSLSIVVVLLFCMLIFVRSNPMMFSTGVAGALLLHQLLDEMWNLPVTWFYPLMGPFQGFIIPDYVLTYFWLEITNPSEWMFMSGTVVILAVSYQYMPVVSLFSLTDRMRTGVYRLVVLVIFGIGLYMVAAGLTQTTDTVITPTYNQISNLMAGVLTISGAVISGLKQ